MLNKYDIEEIILGMADIVRENRDLRDELNRANNTIKILEKNIRESAKNSEEANKELLKMLFERSLTKINNGL